MSKRVSAPSPAATAALLAPLTPRPKTVVTYADRLKASLQSVPKRKPPKSADTGLAAGEVQAFANAIDAGNAEALRQLVAQYQVTPQQLEELGILNAIAGSGLGDSVANSMVSAVLPTPAPVYGGVKQRDFVLNKETSAINFAARRGYAATVKKLLSYGCIPNHAMPRAEGEPYNELRHTPTLILACMSGNNATVTNLLDWEVREPSITQKNGNVRQGMLIIGPANPMIRDLYNPEDPNRTALVTLLLHRKDNFLRPMNPTEAIMNSRYWNAVYEDWERIANIVRGQGLARSSDLVKALLRRNPFLSV